MSEKINDEEASALLGSKMSVISVVSALRKYRAASKKLLGSRYTDGECDAVAIHIFEDACRDAEDDLVNQ